MLSLKSIQDHRNPSPLSYFYINWDARYISFFALKLRKSWMKSCTNTQEKILLKTTLPLQYQPFFLSLNGGGWIFLLAALKKISLLELSLLYYIYCTFPLDVAALLLNLVHSFMVLNYLKWKEIITKKLIYKIIVF